ncbi:MAG: DinB family protein, partial [Candidatus Hodarchaeales archaeon]
MALAVLHDALLKRRSSREDSSEYYDFCVPRIAFQELEKLVQNTGNCQYGDSMKVFDFIKLQSYALENQCRYCCRELSLADFKWKPETGSPAIGWIVGHIILSHDMTPNKQLLGNELVLSDEFKQFFGFKSSGDFPDSFDPEKMLEKFQIINKQIVASLSAKTEEWLSEFPEETDKFPPQ